MRIKRNLAEFAKYVLDTTLSFGVNVSPASRLGQVYRLLVNANDGPVPYIPSAHPEFSVVREAVRDLNLLAFIFDELRETYAPADMKKRVRRLVEDAALPQKNKTLSRGRDEQCELYVAAIAAKAGLLPRFAEPDLLCQCRQETLGIAVKRIKSEKRLQERIKSAAEQIRRSGVPGVIAADLTMALNPTNVPFLPRISDQTYADVVLGGIRGFVNQNLSRFVKWTRGAKVQGIIIMYHDIRQDPVEGWSLESTTVSTHLSQHNERRRREFVEFANQFQMGLATEPFRC